MDLKLLNDKNIGTKVLDIISVKGELNIQDGVTLRTFCEEYIEKYNKNFTMDLDVTTPGSPIINTISYVSKICKKKGIIFDIICPKDSDDLYDILNMCSLTNNINIYQKEYKK